MKKITTALFLLCTVGMAKSQTPSTGAVKTNVIQQKVFTEQPGSGTPSTKRPLNRGNVNSFAFVEIGTSWYDLQTNYAMPSRLMLYNGNVLSCWTTAPNSSTGYPQRGTGYNFRNTTKDWLPSTNTKVESSSFRTGWPSIGVLRNGNAFVIGHEANNGGFYLSKFADNSQRSVTSTLILQELPYKPIWSRMGNSGDTIHMIYSYTDSAAAGEKRAPTRKGIFAPMVYSRSINGGTSWDIKALMLPGWDSTLTTNGGADQYAIAVRGNTVAIVNGDLLQGTIAWISNDAGATWKMEKPLANKYAPFNNKVLTQFPMIIDFEDLEINNIIKGNSTSKLYKTGKDLKGTFYMNWDNTGSIWNNAWIASELNDTSAAGKLDTNKFYLAAAGVGANNSANYAVCKSKGGIAVSRSNARIHSVDIVLTKGTVDLLKNGNGSVKKFGGPSGKDADFLRVTVSGLSSGIKIAQQDIILADYRSADSTKDYIQSSWNTINISKLVGIDDTTQIDSLSFVISSSDASATGLNSVATFAIDNLHYRALERVPTCDGTVDVMIDKNNKTHVFWGAAYILNDDSTDASSYSFYPATQNIGYWNEYTKEPIYIANGDFFSTDLDTVNALTAATTNGLASSNGTTVIPTGLSTVARLGTSSAVRQPNASIDKNGVIYCIFSVPIEKDLSIENANFRDIGIVYSKDSGKTWSREQNMTQQKEKEDDFACIAKESDDFIHMMWQQDETPGTNLQNNAPSNNHPPVENKIMYTAVPVSEILNGYIGMYWGLNTQKPNQGEVMIVNQNFPNPFTGKSNLLIYLTQPGAVTLSVHNALGQEVQNKVYSGLNKGNHLLEINSTGLKSGLYTYSITSGANTITKTMIVQ